MKKRHLTLIGSLTLATALGLTACASPGDSTSLEGGISIDTPAPSSTAPSTPSPEPTPSQAPEPPGASSADLHETTRAALDAIALAESTAGGVAYQLSDDDDETAWEVDVNVQGDEVEVRVNWAGTEVLRSERDDSVDDDTRRKLEAATITMQQAIIAASAHAAGYVDEAELDTDNGVVIWEIKFDDGDEDWDVDVNAQTGDIIKVDRD